MTIVEARTAFRALVRSEVGVIGDRMIFGLPKEGFPTPFITCYGLSQDLHDTHDGVLDLIDVNVQLMIVTEDDEQAATILEDLLGIHSTVDANFQRVAFDPGPGFWEDDHNRYIQVVETTLSFR